MIAASGIAGGAAAATVVAPVAAQDDDGDGNDTDDGGDEAADGGDGNETDDGEGNESEDGGGGGGGGGGTEEVIVGPNGDLVFDPDELVIEPGTTVVFTWDSDNHNINPSSVPDDADWEGHMPIEDTGFEYEYTFEVEGEYDYVCDPHVGSGMEGTIIVDPDAGEQAAAGGADIDVHDYGVPIQAHYVGIATILAIFVSLVFTFYLLKYGESANTSSPGRR